MDENDLACFRCGQIGHLRANCPQDTPPPASQSPSDRPAWCGDCDRRTRLIEYGGYMTRCHTCWAWPAKGTYPGQLPAQYKRCACNHVIYTWDMKPCGEHQSVRIGPIPLVNG